MEKKPKTKTREYYLPYRSLVKKGINWNEVFESKKDLRDAEESPGKQTLMLGFLVRITDLLEEINTEIKRKRILS